MTCKHGFIGSCADCDGSGQIPEQEPSEHYEIAECGGCGEMTPVCCDTADGPYCAVCCPRSHGIVGRSNYSNSDCGWDV